MAPNARTLPITRVRWATSANAEPMSPQNGTSHTV